MGQQETEQKVPNWHRCDKTSSCSGRGFVGRFCGDYRGDAGRPPTATPQMAFGTRSRDGPQVGATPALHMARVAVGSGSTASAPVGCLLNSGKKKDGDDRKCSSCLIAVGARP